MNERCKNCVDLHACQVGASGVVSCVLRTDDNLATVRRLAELGVRPGAVLTAVQKTPGGGRVIAVGDSRVALDKATLRTLHICSTAEAPHTPTAAVA